MRIKSYDDLQQFQSFTSLDELNHSIKSFKEYYSEELNYSDLALIDIISQYSVKYFGVCYLKNKTLCELSSRSESTIERSKRKLKKLGLITIQKTTRGVKCPGQGANIMVIRPFDKPNDTPCDNGNYKALNNTPDKAKEINKRMEDESQTKLDNSFVNDKFAHPSFIRLAKNFWNDFKMINTLWSKVRLAAYKFNFENDLEIMSDIGANALKQTVGQLKRKKVRDVLAYFYSVLNAKFEALYFEKLGEFDFNPDVPADHWLVS